MIDLKRMSDNWPSPFVARREMEKFTMGLYKGKSMNSFDARGEGIRRRIKRGEKVAYLKEDVIEWLQTKINGIKGRQK